MLGKAAGILLSLGKRAPPRQPFTLVGWCEKEVHDRSDSAEAAGAGQEP